MPDPVVATRQYIEDAMIAVRDYLQDQLPAMLRTVASERDVSIPEPARYSIGPDKRNRYPKVEIMPDISTHDYGFEDNPLIRPWLFHNLVLTITQSQVGNVDVVQGTLLRYVEAVNRIQEADDTFGGAFTWVQLGEEDYSPVIEAQQSRQIMQQVTIELSCKTL